jgi:uncharacterized protein
VTRERASSPDHTRGLGFASVDFFVYSRDAADAAALREDPELLEEHWAYMDAFADSMIARGPTLDADRENATGSLHVLGLSGVTAVREFVAAEPNNRAGLYREHELWRFENLLGRSMWEFSSRVVEPRFLIVGCSQSAPPVSPEALPAELRERLILYGVLGKLDDGEPAGVALAVQARDRGAAVALAENALRVSAGVEIHDWEFGGRR